MVRTIGSRCMVVAVGTVAAALLAGCSVLEDQPSGGTQSPAPSKVRHAASESASPGSSNSNSESSESGRSGGSQHVSDASSGGGVQRCHTADLSAHLDDPPRQLPTDPQGELGAAGIHLAIDLVWTNHSSKTCTMRGFPGVDLRGPAPGTGDAVSYSLPRTGTPQAVTLAPGKTARSVIRYIDPRKDQVKAANNPGAYWWPEKLSVTPPGETTQLTVDWTAGTPVDYQDKASGVVAASTSPIQPA